MPAAQATERGVIVLRHASAGQRHPLNWQEDERKLDGEGRITALLLAGSLSEYGVTRILSSPARRCTETVEPLAERLRVPIEIRRELAIGGPIDTAGALLDACDGVALICTHREVIAELVATEPVPPKGAALRLGYTDGQRYLVEQLPAPRPDLALEPA